MTYTFLLYLKSSRISSTNKRHVNNSDKLLKLDNKQKKNYNVQTAWKTFNIHFPFHFEIYTCLKPRNGNMQSSTSNKSKTDIFLPVRIEMEDRKGSLRAI